MASCVLRARVSPAAQDVRTVAEWRRSAFTDGHISHLAQLRGESHHHGRPSAWPTEQDLLTEAGLQTGPCRKQGICLQATIRNHSFRLEGDVLAGKLSGDLTIARESARLAKVPGQAGHIDCRGSAVYGASLATRTVVTLVLRALEAFKLATSATRFFKTQQEARSFLVQLRKA